MGIGGKMAEGREKIKKSTKKGEKGIFARKGISARKKKYKTLKIKKRSKRLSLPKKV